MVQSGSFAGMIFSLAISFLGPILIALIYYKQSRFPFSSLLTGALVFFISQIIIRLPLLSLLSLTPFFQKYSSNLLFSLLVYALTAGLFEEGGRYLGFRILGKRRYLKRSDAIAFGIGHGGIEAMLLLGANSANNLFLALAINSGIYDTSLAPSLGEQANHIKEALITTPPADFFIGGLERVAVFPIHIALSILVCYAVREHKISLLFAAIAAHTLVNAPAAFYASFNWNIFLVEAIVLVFALLAISFIVQSKKLFAQKAASKPSAEGAPSDTVAEP